jgi:hypothetical protein
VFTIIAAIEPTSVEFHIHHVASVFQVIRARDKRRKNNLFRPTLSARYSSGINAMKIKNVSGDTGHEAHNKIPDKRLKLKVIDFFKAMIVFRAARSEILLCNNKPAH